MLTALLTLAASWLPTLAIGAGPVGLLLGLLPKLAPSWRTWLRIGAVAMAAFAIAGATVHYMKLRGAAAELAELRPKIAALGAALGCQERPPAERDLFTCLPARDRDAALARERAEQQAADALRRAQAELSAKADNLQSELDAANDVIDDAAEVDDGPLPKVMRDNWARERTRRGVK